MADVLFWLSDVQWAVPMSDRSNFWNCGSADAGWPDEWPHLYRLSRTGLSLLGTEPNQRTSDCPSALTAMGHLS
jgi:hypothetical protein